MDGTGWWFGVTRGFVDTAGSIIIHAFGAYFGIGLTLALTTAQQRNQAIQSDATSDRFAMIGSLAAWQSERRAISSRRRLRSEPVCWAGRFAL